MYENYENNCIAMLAFASTRATWVSTASFAEKCGIAPAVVYSYLSERRGNLWQQAEYHRYEIAIRSRPTGASIRRTYYMSAVYRGYT